MGPARYVQSWIWSHTIGLKSSDPNPAVATTLLAALCLSVALFAVACSNGDKGGVEAPTAMPTVVSPSPGTASPTPTATAEAAATAIPAGALGYVEHVPVLELTAETAAGALPAPLFVYFTETCAVCIDQQLYRITIEGTTAGPRESLLVANQPGLPPGYPLAVLPGGSGRWAAIWCVVGERGCGKTHSEVPDTTPRAIVRSDDGGVTWRLLTDVPWGAYPLAFDGNEVIVSVPDANGGVEYRAYPSGSARTAPDAAIMAPPGVRVRASQDQTLANDTTTIVTVVQGTSSATAAYAFPGANLQVGVAISSTLLLGATERNAKAQVLNPPRDLEGFPRLPVLIDLAARTVAPLANLKPEDPNGWIHPVAVQSAEHTAEVTGTGDCLNVRDQPTASARVVACVADRVLLSVRNVSQTADGILWRAVTTPDGHDGWASSDFLRPR